MCMAPKRMDGWFDVQTFVQPTILLFYIVNKRNRDYMVKNGRKMLHTKDFLILQEDSRQSNKKKSQKSVIILKMYYKSDCMFYLHIKKIGKCAKHGNFGDSNNKKVYSCDRKIIEKA